MYLSNSGGYYDSDGTQRARRGPFLLFLQPPGVAGCDAPIKCAVRKVALHQFGHFMMGTARLYGHSLTVSGTYGHDGLVCEVPADVYNRAPMALPPELVEAWNKGGGHNSAGSEAAAVRKWALENLELLST